MRPPEVPNAHAEDRGRCQRATGIYSCLFASHRRSSSQVRLCERVWRGGGRETGVAHLTRHLLAIICICRTGTLTVRLPAKPGTEGKAVEEHAWSTNSQPPHTTSRKRGFATALS